MDPIQTPVQTPIPVDIPQPKPNLIIIISSILGIILLASAIFLYFQNQKLKKQSVNQQASPTIQTPFPTLKTVSSISIPPDEVKNWKTYTNNKLGVEFMYPVEWPAPKELSQSINFSGKLIIVKGPFYDHVLQRDLNFDEYSVRSYGDETSRYDFNIDGLIGKRGLEKSVSNYSDIVILAKNNKSTEIISIAYIYNPKKEDGKLFDQILSTFKFLDNTEPESSLLTSLEKIQTISTSNWKNVSNNGVQFKIVPEANCNDNQNCTLASWTSQYQGNTLYHSIRVEVKEYLGGSRREQFYQNVKPECHDIYQEASFGSIKALQIAVDGGWCQGGGGGIITVIGNKLVIVHNLSYNLETKVIDRWDIRDTLISTLRSL